MRPLIIAHRGASHLAPENTLTAFRLAKTLGADGFECDVQITRDRHLVVAHDYLTDLKTGVHFSKRNGRHLLGKSRRF